MWCFNHCFNPLIFYVVIMTSFVVSVLDDQSSVVVIAWAWANMACPIDCCMSFLFYSYHDMSDSSRMVAGCWVNVQQQYHTLKFLISMHELTYEFLSLSSISLVSRDVRIYDVLVHWWDGTWTICVHNFFCVNDCKFDSSIAFISQWQ